LIFESTDPKKGWDGTFRNQKLRDGNYMYQVTIDKKGVANDVIFKKGVIHLFN
jgi:hypothetical protein